MTDKGIDGWHVINLKLKSHDACLCEEEAQELFQHFLEDGYLLTDIIVIKGLQLGYSIRVEN